MRRISICVAATLAACSQSHADTPNLPTKFVLECGAPTGSEIPDGAEKGFKISVDQSNNTYSLPWDVRTRPIGKLATNEIIFADEHVDRGIDNNPEDRKITYDLSTGVLRFQEQYSAFVPVDRDFSAMCKIIKNA